MPENTTTRRDFMKAVSVGAALTERERSVNISLDEHEGVEKAVRRFDLYSEILKSRGFIGHAGRNAISS